MCSLHKDFWFEPRWKMLISNLPKLDDTCDFLPSSQLGACIMFLSELMRAVWPLRRMPALLQRWCRLPPSGNHPYPARTKKPRQHLHKNQMRPSWQPRLHAGWRQTVWLHALSFELQPAKTTFLLWCWLPLDGCVCTRIGRQPKRGLRAFGQSFFQRSETWANRPCFFAAKLRGGQGVFRLEKNHTL